MSIDNCSFTQGHTSDNYNLITACDVDNIKIVNDWIKENIVEYKKKTYPLNSYALRHVLEATTGLYLTNDEFKNAMLLAGFKPKDPNALNWEFFIRMRKDIPRPTGPFYDFVAARYKDKLSKEGDFCKVMMDDIDFPVIADKKLILDYLHSVTTLDDVFDIFEILWSEYATSDEYITSKE